MDLRSVGLEWSDEPRPLSWPWSVDVGKVLMVGAGSVGSAAAYCARIAGLRGSVDILASIAKSNLQGDGPSSLKTIN